MVRRRELGARERGGNQGVMRQEIDLAGKTGDRLKERFVRRRIEERDGGPARRSRCAR